MRIDEYFDSELHERSERDAVNCEPEHKQFVALAYSAKRPPAVVYWLHQMGIEDTSEYSEFSDFIYGLHSGVERVFQKHTDICNLRPGDFLHLQNWRNNLDVVNTVTVFRQLTEVWFKETRRFSSTTQIVMHECYQQIIGLGPAAVPLIISELNSRLYHWFWALRAITRQDPVPLEEQGDMEKMRDRWVNWWSVQNHGRQRRYYL